jgi:CRISPR-associated protein Csx3
MINSDTSITSKDLPAILIGGAPKAGKSVLTYNLTQELRKLKTPHYVFRASPDGEGDWFLKVQYQTGQEVGALRQIHLDAKVDWTNTFRQLICQALSKRQLPLIVDIGGDPQP